MSQLNYQRLYEYRFRNVDQSAREAVWREIASDLYRHMGSPLVVLDPAAGRCEFINAVPARERWAIDSMDTSAYRSPEVRGITGDALTVELPFQHFDAVLISNLLEHLASPEDVASLLAKMRTCIKPGGSIAILGPNFQYCARQYFDCADHVLALTHVAVAEHLYAAGFEPHSVIPRYLPYSFRGVLPPSPTLTRIYLKQPILWRLLGKQFLVVAK